MQMTGDICFDSEKPTQQFIRKTVGYVMQNDYLLPNVTGMRNVNRCSNFQVRETLRYAALLRLPSDITYKEKISIADRILTNLNLKECADTYIGIVSSLVIFCRRKWKKRCIWRRETKS